MFLDGIEVAGVLSIFICSLLTQGICYRKYLGDGDSRAYQRVAAEKPLWYKNFFNKTRMFRPYTKKKRMEARLRRMVKETTGTKFHDVRPLRGRGHFTKSETYKLQNYYSLAIRRNVHNLEALKGPVWAIFFYKLSINGKPPT
jgi:hypothetical protein